MKLAAVLNSESGTLKTLDSADLLKTIEREFSLAGYVVDGSLATGETFTELLGKAMNSEADIVLVAGGDGSISSAAADCWKSGKSLAVLPGGTMNLFARALRIPLDLQDAVKALAGGRLIRCGLATANGRPFIHQYSVGMHPQLVEERDNYDFDSRLSKIFASFRAFTSQIANPPTIRTAIRVDGREEEAMLSNLSVSNNPYGDGHLPYFDNPCSGKLGIYTAGILDVADYLALAADLAAGTWRSNSDICEQIADRVDLTFPEIDENSIALIDGELIELDSHVTVEAYPEALNVLVPEAMAERYRECDGNGNA